MKFPEWKIIVPCKPLKIKKGGQSLRQRFEERTFLEKEKRPADGAQSAKPLFLKNGSSSTQQALNTTSPPAIVNQPNFKVMKKLKIGLFSLFALTAGGTAVISAIPQSAVAAPASPFWGWFWKSLAQLAFDWIKIQIQNGAFNIHLKPGTPTPAPLDLSSLYAGQIDREALAADGVIITDNQITFGGDLVLKNDAEYTVLAKKGTYRVDAQRKSVIPLDIFKPSPTVPERPGTLIR